MAYVKVTGRVCNQLLQCVKNDQRFLSRGCASLVVAAGKVAVALPTATPCHQQIHRRHFFDRKMLNPFDRNNKRKAYTEERVLGYSMEQMYNIVAEVDQYQDFIPWCTRSTMFSHRPGHCKATMEVGFPPIVERYTSNLTLVRPRLVRAECRDGRLFSQLLTTWQFSPGLPENPNSCTLRFSVAFEFQSRLHSKLATLFFDEVVNSMVNAFLKQARRTYGPASIKNQKPTVLVHHT